MQKDYKNPDQKINNLIVAVKSVSKRTNEGVTIINHSTFILCKISLPVIIIGGDSSRRYLSYSRLKKKLNTEFFGSHELYPSILKDERLLVDD